MKKIVASTLLAGSLTFALGAGDAGCGLGSLVMGNDGNQILAATTNGTYSNQTFGMTSGTSGCKSALFASNDSEIFKFMENNMDAIALNISQGEGEYLDTLAQYLNTDSTILGETLKANFDSIYTKDDMKVSEVIDNIYTVINS